VVSPLAAAQLSALSSQRSGTFRSRNIRLCVDTYTYTRYKGIHYLKGMFLSCARGVGLGAHHAHLRVLKTLPLTD